MTTPQLKNKFGRFFKQQAYVLLKNSLYNYRLRRSAISRHLRKHNPRVILEAGSGLSPVSGDCGRTVYSDLSFAALTALKSIDQNRVCVVADCCQLPFKAATFSHSVCSEVLEHIPDDRRALWELARVTGSAGQLIITFPHRKCYYARDDRYVNHYRRYEIDEMGQYLRKCGYIITEIQKILGPLEKLAMITAVGIHGLLQKRMHPRSHSSPLPGQKLFNKMFQLANLAFMVPVWIETRILPVSFATVLMIIAEHKHFRKEQSERK